MTVLSDGTEQELLPEGAERPVSFEDRQQYVALCTQARLSEWDEQMAAIREGLCEVLPPMMLACMSWQQLEKRVCSDVVDVEGLRASTIYRTLPGSCKTAKYFWEVPARPQQSQTLFHSAQTFAQPIATHQLCTSLRACFQPPQVSTPVATLYHCQQPFVTPSNRSQPLAHVYRLPYTIICIPLQSAVTLHNPLQPATALHNPPQPSTTLYNPLQLSATLCNPPQPSTTLYNPLQPSATLCDPLQPCATLCNPLQPSTTVCNPIEIHFIEINFVLPPALESPDTSSTL